MAAIALGLWIALGAWSIALFFSYLLVSLDAVTRTLVAALGFVSFVVLGLTATDIVVQGFCCTETYSYPWIGALSYMIGTVMLVFLLLDVKDIVAESA